MSKRHRVTRRRISRDTVSYLLGWSGVAWMIVTHTENVWALILCGTVIGVPMLNVLPYLGGTTSTASQRQSSRQDRSSR